FRNSFCSLEQSTGKAYACNGSEEVMSLNGNYTSTASFFVSVGVMGMLFSLFALVVYVFFQPTYEFMEWIPVADTVIHGIFTLMWFGSSIAWATALSQVKKHTKCDGIFESNSDICDIDICTCVDKIEYQLLDFSVIFGFLNVILYGGNVWFVFKETKFFKK
ncbi:Marvel domain, partial [Trinorchestia longiramus]